MKVSEAIDRLEVGETLWAKVIVNAINFEGEYIRIDTTKMATYLDGNAEISLTEPQDEKVELEADQQFVADWYEANKWDLEGNMFSLTVDIWEKGDKTDFEKWFNNGSKNCAVETLIKMKLNGYTVKPNRWVVKFVMIDAVRYFSKFNGCNDLDYNYVGRKENAHIFTDKAKAEAVATLVEGTVEEVAE